MSVKLKPCPFCGGHAIIDGCDDGQWIVICKECATSIGYNETKQEAIEEWNWRIEPTFTPDQLKEIRLMFDIGVRKLPDSRWVEIWQSIVDKCDDTLKGGNVE
nr:MAG TPA: restriction alleviation protein [Caudoviricetes sp.]